MDFTMSTLGLELLTLVSPRRRKLSISQPSSRRQLQADDSDMDSLMISSKRLFRSLSWTKGKTMDDDETYTTLSLSSSENDDFGKMVHFAEPLVTAVHHRPATTSEDKYYLHYNEHDYIDFKLEILTGKSRTRKVSFSREVVSEIREVQPLKEAHLLYYSESELQQFLDEFVQSLNQRL